MVESYRTTTEESEAKCQGGQRQRKFVSIVANEPVVKMYLGNGDCHVDADGKRCHASEQADQDQQPAEEFGEGRKVSAPGRETETGHKLDVMVKSAKYFLITVDNKDRAEHKAHD